MAFVTIRHPDNKMENVPIPTDKETVFGRSSTADVPFPKDPKISSKHCKIYFDPSLQLFILSDLRSTNGTILNLNRISADVALTDNDKIRIGDIRLLFRLGELNAPTTTTTKKVFKLANKTDVKEVRTDTCVIPNFANIKRKPRLTVDNDFSLSSGSNVGKFQIVDKLADFQYGSVYSAMPHNFQGRVALKIFNMAFDIHHPGLDEFNNCLARLVHLDNPYFVRTVDGGVHMGHCYLVMDFATIEDLNMKIAKCAPIPEEDALSVIYTVAAALESAYASHRLIHGMVSPSSILVDSESNLMIKGHGLASWMTKYVSSGRPISLPWYVSPEQAMCAPFDWQADMYSLGIVLFQLLCGMVPYHSPNDREIYDMHLKLQLPNPRDYNPNIVVSDETLAILNRMAAKNPKDRFASWKDFLKTLEDLSSVLDIETTSTDSGTLPGANVDDKLKDQFGQFFKGP